MFWGVAAWTCSVISNCVLMVSSPRSELMASRSSAETDYTRSRKANLLDEGIGFSSCFVIRADAVGLFSFTFGDRFVVDTIVQ
jgi:hypothetical protein